MTAIKTNWTSGKINLQAAFPQKLEITSSFLFEKNDGNEDFFHITGNLLGIMGGYPCRLDIFDTEKGEVLWTARPYTDELGGRALCDNGILYIGYTATHTPACIKAHKAETGEVIWERKLTNSNEQFGTRMVQTSNHIIAPNVNKDTLFILDKATGKQTAKLSMKNQFEGGRGVFFKDDVVFAYNDKVYILAYKKSHLLDCYNPETAEFEKTLFEFPLSGKMQRIQAIIQIQGDLFLFMSMGEFYHISLTDGKVKACIMPVDKENPNDYFRCPSGFIHNQNKLSLVIRNGKNEDRIFVYNIETGKQEECITIPQLDKDYSIVAPTPCNNTILRYGYGKPSKNGLALYNFDENEPISELILPQYSEKEDEDDADWRRYHLVLGDAIYLIQQVSEFEMGNDAGVLHRIQ